MKKKLTRRSFLISSAAALVSLAACSVGSRTVDEKSTVRGETDVDATDKASKATKAVPSVDLYRAPPLDAEHVDVTERIERSDAEWQELLSSQQYYVVRQKGTEAPFTGEYNDFRAEGRYHCVACGNPLFDSETKYNSGTGWPSFWAPIEEGRLRIETDTSLGMVRKEVLCARCGAHLGHVFNDGPPPTGQRYCLNSIALNFVPADASSSSAPALEEEEEIVT